MKTKILLLVATLLVSFSISAKDEKYPHRRIFKTNKVTPDNLRIDWKKLKLYERKGEDCLSLKSADKSRKCSDIGREEYLAQNYDAALEYFRTGCREVNFITSFLSLLNSPECTHFIEISYKLGDQEMKDYIAELVFNQVRHTKGKKQFGIRYLSSAHSSKVLGELCINFDTSNCYSAVYTLLPVNKDKAVKCVQSYCQKVNEKKCDHFKKYTFIDAKKLGVSLTEVELSEIKGGVRKK